VADTLELIDQLIAEHKVISNKTQSLEDAANDAKLMSELTVARETFVPGRLDQAKRLQKLEEMLLAIDTSLENHFNREETVLLKAVEDRGDLKLIESLNALLFEHSDLRSRLDHAKMRVAELINGSLQSHIWNATANDIRAHLSHTRRPA
jgi:iron-sulfur cluster repair protein YtfE (RIC family)